jgi:hypothetical protein
MIRTHSQGLNHGRFPLRRKSARSTILVLLFLACTGCSPIADIRSILLTSATDFHMNNPSPVPEFINSVTPKPSAKGIFPRQVCIDLSGEALWEPNDKSDDKDFLYWKEHLMLFVDGLPVQISDEQEIWESGPYIRKLNKQGESIGSYVLSYSTCFKTKLERGAHIVTLRVTTTSGLVHSYTWAFHLT